MQNAIIQAQTLEREGHLAEAIQVYDNILSTQADTSILALANFRIGTIYREWREFLEAQRYLARAHQLTPENSDIRSTLAELNQYFSENQEQLADEIARKNSARIVSLFRIATGIKLLTMDKPVQAYPLLKSRTKIFPNAAVAKHLLTDISITEAEVNSAIEFLLERGWLVHTAGALYSIAESGLYAFYTELAQLHTANHANLEAVTCYEQAYWLDNSRLTPLFQKIICYTNAELWDDAVASLEHLPDEIPEDINTTVYYTAVARSYHAIYSRTKAEDTKQKVIHACEQVLHVNKKDKAISKLLASYQGKKNWWWKK